MILHLLCDSSAHRASSQSFKMIPEKSWVANAQDDFEDQNDIEGSDFDEDDGPLDFDPSLGEVDVLGDFGLDDEPSEPEPGDFWIDGYESWD